MSLFVWISTFSKCDLQFLLEMKIIMKKIPLCPLSGAAMPFLLLSEVLPPAATS